MRRPITLAAALLLLAAACGGAAPATTTTTTVPPATTTAAPPAPAAALAGSVPVGFHEYRGDGFRMLMPDDWTIAARGDVELQAILGELSASGLDDLVPAIEGAFAEGGKLFAFDFGASTIEFTNNINILRLDPPGLSAANLVAVAEKDIRRLGATGIAGRVERLPAGEAVIVNYSLPEDLGGGEGLSYTVLTDDSQWVVTYTASDVAPFTASFAMMMESFREE